MATTRGLKLSELIADGSLRIGTKLHHPARRYHARAVDGIVVAGGLIRVGSQTFATPSAAARSVTGTPVDGWLWWKLPDGRPLGDLRP